MASWPLHLVKQEGAQLSLAADDCTAVEWWLTPEETMALPEGECTLGVAFDPKRVEGLPAGAAAPRSDRCRLRVEKEAVPLSQAMAAEKLYQQGWYYIVRDDQAGAGQAASLLMAADPKGIGARRLKAVIAARAGRVEEGLALIDEALSIYWEQYPEACPPAGLLSLRGQLRAQKPKPAAGP
ncbi:hypothetical protein LLH23_01670 [bacterium]|nr:hypothetical protein [bacterium]